MSSLYQQIISLIYNNNYNNITLERERIRSGRKRKDSPATNPYEDENNKGEYSKF